MDIFSLIMVAGGLAFFLYGMSIMSTGLERMAGGKLEKLLKSMTDNVFKSLLLGAGITIAIQSSSATTVMLVGLVNSGIMTIEQSVGIIMGSNVGTTLTAWLLSLVGLESSNMFLKLLKPENFSLIFALIGILLIMTSKKQKKKSIGSILIGFAILMYGMKLMSDAVAPLADMPEFAQVLTAFRNPLIGVLIGALVTGIIQSSAASVGILQALALTGTITYGMAIPIIMGQNIGTCVTSLISSIGVNKNAKKVSVVHISFNLIGTVVFMIIYSVCRGLLEVSLLESPINSFGIAVVHSIFNIGTTVILVPFNKLLVLIADFVIPGNGEDEESTIILDERLLATPSIAISEANSAAAEMARIAKSEIIRALDIMVKYDEDKAEEIVHLENRLDSYEDAVGSYMVKLNGTQLSEADSLESNKILYAIGDFERLGDHGVNIMYSIRKAYEANLEFTDDAKEEIAVLVDAVKEIVYLATQAYIGNNIETAICVEPLEQVIDNIVFSMKSRHMVRLKEGKCSIDMGFILQDILLNCSRISDHCSNIAAAVIEIYERHSYDTHKYLNTVKSGDKIFDNLFEDYSEKYSIE
ncbi:MAG: Na/Pi cotransporter family protein [Lachnospiraceae bacterium]|jgi:phosphate:Na+ symporter|nr:Na/Pi cotransporter family protein [Lachnospiraceae bacterium]MDD6579990.1 Na/Pi cotransporter family protein [Lachnospiraceae bacterium]MDD7223953.1 Na/Pi cotransporter family protein [Lachnospiraceae bacterium]MDO4508315.1 Na/Pi cotransporter family protein [Lachnospiraceae bacterium]MDY4428520.1 Na/Pi cotransporter family protein [Lachnospiraceae bacterium]